MQRARYGIEVAALDGDGNSIDAQLEAQLKLVIGENFAAGLSSRGDRVPPEQASALLKIHDGVLPVSRTREGDKRIRQIFEQRAFASAYVRREFGRCGLRTAAIETGGAGRRDLRARPRANV